MSDSFKPQSVNHLVSIIVPVYNVEKYLHRCVDSILSQDYVHLEVILVNDGSTDNSPMICDAYAQSDGRIKVIHKPNGGLSDARNTGIDHATGEYIAFVDSDDYVDRTYINTMLLAALENEADLVMCNFECVSDNGDSIAWQPGRSFPAFYGKVASNSAMIAFSDPVGGVYVVSWNKLYKNSLFNNVRFPVGKIHEDQFVIHHLVDQCDFIFCVPDRLYYYVQRENSIMAGGYSRKHLDAMGAFYDRAHFYKNKREYRLMSLSYKQYCNELAKSYYLMDMSDSLNREQWEIYHKLAKKDLKVVFKHAYLNTIMRFIAAVYCPALYYKVLQRPWRRLRQ